MRMIRLILSVFLLLSALLTTLISLSVQLLKGLPRLGKKVAHTQNASNLAVTWLDNE